MNTEYTVHFSPGALSTLNIILGLILFGIALDLRKEDFQELMKRKKSALVGLLAHFGVLPLLTFILAYILSPPPAIALGMILVGACPGGNMTNMFSYLAKGNVALSVGLTSVSHLLAVIIAPINFAFYGSMLPGTQDILRSIRIDLAETVITLGTVIVLPLVCGLLIAAYKPLFAEKMRPYMKRIALLAFAVFLVFAVYTNKEMFIQTFNSVFPIVVLHNALALLAGYLLARSFSLPDKDVRTISFETGVQNAGLGLVLVFNFFSGLAGMAVVAALWGVWHLVSGGLLAMWWGRR
jgi:bile acid:Na+ symporter, BASS family